METSHSGHQINPRAAVLASDTLTRFDICIHRRIHSGSSNGATFNWMNKRHLIELRRPASASMYLWPSLDSTSLTQHIYTNCKLDFVDPSHSKECSLALIRRYLFFHGIKLFKRALWTLSLRGASGFRGPTNSHLMGPLRWLYSFMSSRFCFYFHYRVPSRVIK